MRDTKLPVWMAWTMAGWLAVVIGCATPAPKPQASGPLTASERARAELADSSVDISYVLGRSHHRLVAWARNDSFGGQTLLDHQILHESGIDRQHYTEFLGKVEQFVSNPHRKPAEQPVPAVKPAEASAAAGSEEACRTPFTVTVRVGADTKSLQGCRGADDGALSHLVRDGEFLLYSNK